MIDPRRRPRIGISGPDEGGYPAWVAASWCVRAAGGIPIRVTPSRGIPATPLDGLVLGGGADVDPDRYGVEPEEAPRVRERLAGRTARSRLRTLAGLALSPAVYAARRVFSVRLGGLDHARDELELALLTRADQDRAPVLGICRGAQLLNVYCGGTLHQDLSSFYGESPNPWTVFPRKWIAVEPDSSLLRALGRSRCAVNSLHRQAVDRLGDDLVVSATEDNGVVQAVERRHHPFFIGVQWHPEYLPQRPEQRLLFRRFVEEARRCAEARATRSGVRGVHVRADEHVGPNGPVPQEDGERKHQPQER